MDGFQFEYSCAELLLEKEKIGNKEFEALFEKGKIDGVSEEIVQNSEA